MDIRAKRSIIEDMRTGRPITLPGFWGPLAAQEGGVQVLAEKLGVKDVRTLRRWACNERGIDAIVAAKIEDLEPPEGAFKVYLDPITADLVASAPEGWVRFDAVRNGWARRSAWIGNPYDLLPGDPDKARAAGWPW